MIEQDISDLQARLFTLADKLGLHHAEYDGQYFWFTREEYEAIHGKMSPRKERRDKAIEEYKKLYQKSSPPPRQITN